MGLGGARNGNHGNMDPFVETIAPDVAQLAPLRRALASWLELAGVADPPRADLVLAAHEAAANAMEHGNPEQSFEVTGTIVDHVLTMEISDTGRWEGLRRGSVDRGRGLTLIEALVTSMEIVTGGTGTTLRLVQRL
jgi:anti-sigma regulatory factor (Ser/Thr protein kinase)